MAALQRLKRALKDRLPEPGLPLVWSKRSERAWLCERFAADVVKPPRSDRFRRLEATADAVNAFGAQPLWEGYREVYRQDATVPFAEAAMQRRPDQVRTKARMGRLFAWLAEQRHPALVVEIGTAFGVSAMYWAAGLERAEGGRLLTFEPNPVWHRIAADHLRAFGDVVRPVLGTFEEHVERELQGRAIGLAFVDAIHTSAFVDAEVDLLLPRMEPRGLVVLDDIAFSDDMRACWERWASDDRVLASVAVDGRAGILELAS
jgi:predicted O-methyltransferase YrrM